METFAHKIIPIARLYLSQITVIESLFMHDLIFAARMH